MCRAATAVVLGAGVTAFPVRITTRTAAIAANRNIMVKLRPIGFFHARMIRSCGVTHIGSKPEGARNISVIPSAVEGPRRATVKLRHGVPRLRCATLGMTALGAAAKDPADCKLRRDRHR